MIVTSRGLACFFFSGSVCDVRLGRPPRRVSCRPPRRRSRRCSRDTRSRSNRRIELRQVGLRDVSGEAVDEQQAATLPLPARGVRARVGVFGGHCIVYAKRPPDHKQAVGQLMRKSGGVFLEPGVHKQRTYFQVEQPLSGGAGRLAEIHLPNVMTSGLGMAAHSLEAKQSEDERWNADQDAHHQELPQHELKAGMSAQRPQGHLNRENVQFSGGAGQPEALFLGRSGSRGSSRVVAQFAAVWET